MSCRELIESLRSAGDKKVGNLWQDAEAEAARIRTEIAAKMARMRAENARIRSSSAEALMKTALSEANGRARRTRLGADQVIAGRLLSAAVGSLRRLREENYEGVFEKLARELPALKWHLVRVNPEDVGYAKKYFPGAEIVPDGSITGGVDATTEGDAVRVVNTLEKRLERAWTDMLPDLMKEVYREVADGSSAKS